MAKYIIGLYKDEDSLISAIKNIRSKHVPIQDVLIPYPIHGLDDAMGLSPSKLPVVAFVVGFFGAIFALSFQIWSLTESWAINVGGKPGAAIPSFIPITFEVMVLSASLSMVAAFFIRSKLYPRLKVDVLDERLTDDTFAVVIDPEKGNISASEIQSLFKENSAVEVNEKEV
ncbi:MAG: DUF3341 domain-containing protein [Spirochaetota bacterium]|nr:DUF3341 domain-containing protein [Spirochaetota bacterium]